MNKLVGEPQAFEILRSFGQKYFEKHSWPTKKHENWHYNTLDVFKNTVFLDATSEYSNEKINDLKTQPKDHCGIHLEPIPNWYRIVFFNGIYSPSLSNLPTQESVRILTLANALQKGLYPIFDLSKPTNSFEALNLSHLREGVFIDIPANTVVDKPIELYFYNTSNESSYAYFPRVIIQAQANSQATILEHYHSQVEFLSQKNSEIDETSTEIKQLKNSVQNWTNIQIEAFLHEQSNIQWARLQNQCPTHLHTCRTFIKMYEKSRLHFLTQAQGAKLHKHEFNLEILGENCEAITHGISMGNNHDQKDNQTCIEFKKGASQAEQIYKSILNDSAQSIFNGKIIIHKNAQKAEASQLNQNLLLSDKAEANTQPQLEIYADDVKASHGATIGQLNPEEVFYFRSRGISEHKAKSMLQKGFVLDLIERFPNEEIKSFLKEHLHLKLGNN